MKNFDDFKKLRLKFRIFLKKFIKTLILKNHEFSTIFLLNLVI